MSQLNVVLTDKATRNNVATAPIIVDLTRRVFGVRFSTALPGGFMSATLSILLRRNEAYEWYERHLMKGINIYEAGQPVWEGRITNIAIRDYGIDLTCEGYWASLADVKIHGMWADSDMSKWKVPTIRGTADISNAITLATHNDKFLFETSDHMLAIGLKYGAGLYVDGTRGMFYYALPRFDLLTDDSIFQPQTIHSMMYTYNMVAPHGVMWDMVVYSAPSAQGSWTERDRIENIGAFTATLNQLSGTRVFPLVADGADVRAVALGLEADAAMDGTADDWEDRILFTNVIVWADNYPLTARRATHKKVITDLLQGNSNIGVDAKGLQVDPSNLLIEESDVDFTPLAFKGETIQDVVASLGEVGIAESKGFQFAEGFYNGDGTSSRAITGLGFQPKVVVIKGLFATDHEAAYRTASMSAGYAVIDQGAAAIDSLDSDGFTVSHNAGHTARVNEDTRGYVWYAFGGSKIVTGTYTGNGGTGTRDIDVGSTDAPEMVWIRPSNSTALRWFVRAGVADTTLPFSDDVARYTDEIKTVQDGSFTIDRASTTINTNTVVYHYVAFKPTPALITGRYTGDSTDDREVPVGPIHFLPDLVVIKNAITAQPAVFCTTTLQTLGTCWYETGMYQINRIQDLAPTGELGRWQIGSDADVNESSAIMYFFACVAGTYPDTDDVTYIPANVGVFGRRKLQFRKRDRANVKWVIPVSEMGEAGLQLERDIAQFWSKIWVKYLEPVTGFEGWTEPAENVLAGLLWNAERFNPMDVGEVPSATAETLRDMYLEDASKPTQRTQLTLTGSIYNAVGAKEPLWRVRPGDLIFLKDLGALPQLRPDRATGLPDALRVLVVKETEYDVDGNELSLVLDYPPLGIEMLLARIERTPAPTVLGNVITSGGLTSPLGSFQF